MNNRPVHHDVICLHVSHIIDPYVPGTEIGSLYTCDVLTPFLVTL